MISGDNYLLSSRGSSPGIFRKQVDLIAPLDRLKVDIFLPIGEKIELRKISMENVPLVLEQWLLKGCMLTPTRLHIPAYNEPLSLAGGTRGTIPPPLGIGINKE